MAAHACALAVLRTCMRARAGELFFIGYQIDAKPPGCWYAGLDAEGALAFDHRVDLKEGVMMHDMAVTQDYGIIVDTPLVFRPEVRGAPSGSAPPKHAGISYLGNWANLALPSRITGCTCMPAAGHWLHCRVHQPLSRVFSLHAKM